MERLEKQDPLIKALKVSLLIHLGLLLILFLKSLVFPSTLITKEYIPSLRVDLVALPDQKTTETVTPALPKADEAPTQEKQPSKKTVAVPEEKADYSIGKKKTKTDRIKSALARIKALEKIREGEAIKGNKVLKGSSSRGEASESVETTYFDLVLDKVRNEWELPQWLKERNLTAKVLVRINRLGSISAIEFLKSSGNDQFDSAVRKSLQSAAPFPAPPISILAGVSQDGIVFGFPLAN